MKALFIHRILDGTAVGRVPLGCLYVGASLKQAGHAVQLVDGCDPRHVRDHIRRHRPDVLLYSTYSSSHGHYIALNRQLKREFPHLVSLFGGIHPTFFPQMVHEDGVDAVCRGEGEDAIVDFLGRMERGDPVHTTPNFWVKHEGQVVENPVRPLVGDIDRLPFPDRALLDAYPSVRRFGSRSFISARGCPYNCTYCFNKPYYTEVYTERGKRVRKRSVENVVEEIAREQAECPFEIVQFEDDIFVFSVDWLREFRQLYTRRVGLPFICNMRAELLSDDVARLLAEAGCRSVWIGLEAGNEQVLRTLLHRNTPNSRTIEAVETIHRHGMNCALELMVGLPTTTLEHDLESLDVCLRCRPTYANTHIFQPLPGIELTRVAIENREFEGDFERLGDYYRSSTLRKGHARALNNLAHLLPLTVRFPALRPLLEPLLLRLPARPVYAAAHKLFKTYTIARRLLPLRPSRYFPLYAYRRLFK